MRTVVMLVSALAIVGCEKPPPPGAGSASASNAAAPSTSAPAPLPPVDKPPALDLEGLKKDLKCSPKAKEGPCLVLEEFGACKAGWSPITQSGDGRWLGSGEIVEQGKPKSDFIVLRARRIGTNEVAPGQLGVKIGLTNVPEDPAQQSTAAAAVRALARGDVANKGNRAIEATNERTDWPESFAQQAENNQIYVATDGGAYLCGDGESQRLFVVRLSGNRDQPSNGLYATLYPIKW